MIEIEIIGEVVEVVWATLTIIITAMEGVDIARVARPLRAAGEDVVHQSMMSTILIVVVTEIGVVFVEGDDLRRILLPPLPPHRRLVLTVVIVIIAIDHRDDDEENLLLMIGLLVDEAGEVAEAVELTAVVMKIADRVPMAVGEGEEVHLLLDLDLDLVPDQGKALDERAATVEVVEPVTIVPVVDVIATVTVAKEEQLKKKQLNIKLFR